VIEEELTDTELSSTQFPSVTGTVIKVSDTKVMFERVVSNPGHQIVLVHLLATSSVTVRLIARDHATPQVQEVTTAAFVRATATYDSDAHSFDQVDVEVPSLDELANVADIIPREGRPRSDEPLGNLGAINPDLIKGLGNMGAINPDLIKGLGNLGAIYPDLIKGLGNLGAIYPDLIKGLGAADPDAIQGDSEGKEEEEEEEEEEGGGGGGDEDEE